MISRGRSCSLTRRTTVSPACLARRAPVSYTHLDVYKRQALHPVDFDADDKLDVAAGWGHYKGRNAMALGAFYRPDERTMFSLGGTVGNGENIDVYKRQQMRKMTSK